MFSVKTIKWGIKVLGMCVMWRINERERIIECILRWFGDGERLDGSPLLEHMYSGECLGNELAGRLKKSGRLSQYSFW